MTVENIAQPAYDTLEPDTRKMLSKVLFPDTLTEFLEILGKQRKLRPLPIKWATQLYDCLEPVTQKIIAVTANESVDVDYTRDLLAGLESATRVICEYYKWDDVVTALDSGDGITIADLQAIVIAQRSVQGTSDFMFQPCSVLVGLMQMSEIGVAAIMNALSGQAS